MTSIKDIVKAYNLVVKGIEREALENKERAYGGVIRSSKGYMVENITRLLLEVAWNELNGDPRRLSFDKHTKRVPIKRDYINKLEDEEVKEYILENINKYYYLLKTDVHCNIDGELVIGVECKAYTENAMMKRILVDFSLMKHGWKNLNCFLVQLESQLGGDYSNINARKIFGSKSTHTLFSYFDVNIEILTLLNGERKVDKPIHNPKYYKELDEKHVRVIVNKFKNVLKQYL